MKFNNSFLQGFVLAGLLISTSALFNQVGGEYPPHYEWKNYCAVLLNSTHERVAGSIQVRAAEGNLTGSFFIEPGQTKLLSGPMAMNEQAEIIISSPKVAYYTLRGVESSRETGCENLIYDGTQIRPVE